MKNISLLLLALLCGFISFAQSPQAFKYQAVARNNAGNTLNSQAVSFRISILAGSAAGAAVYSETHPVTTNSFGLANLEIGNGSTVSGTFEDIDWGNNTYYLKIEMDENGGTSYALMGTSQLHSVPYSMHSETTSDNTRWLKNSTNLYYLNGLVGIGTTVPSYPLDISQTGSSFIRTKSSTSFAGLIIDKGSTSQRGYLIYRTANSDKWFAGLSGDDNYSLSTSYIPDGKFYIESTGNVGIGTTSPDANLEVSDASGEAQIRLTRSSSSVAAVLGFYTGTSSTWSIHAGSGSNNMFIRRGSGNSTGNLGLMTNGGFVGIGTSTPARTLDVHGSWKTARLTSTASGAMLEFVSTTADDWAITTWAGRMVLLSSDDDFVTKADEYNFSINSFYPQSTNTKTLGTDGTRWSDVYSVDGFFSGNVGIGTTDLASGYKLSVDGKIMCEELRVDMSAGWPDYVFGNEYTLLPIKELDAFIQANGHLPNIPPAKEIQEAGLEVGEMQRLMMEKIEELSLYIIEQQKEIDALKGQIHKNQE